MASDRYYAVKEAVDREGSQRKAGVALGLGQSCIWNILKAGPPAPGTAPVKAAVAPGRGLDEFAAVFDVDKQLTDKIARGLAELGEGWEYENDFAAACCIKMKDLVAKRHKFLTHIVSIPRSKKKAWAGTKELAIKMRSIL